MEISGRTLVRNVLFLDTAEYSKYYVADQLRLERSFNRTLSKALETFAARNRDILDAREWRGPP